MIIKINWKLRITLHGLTANKTQVGKFMHNKDTTVDIPIVGFLMTVGAYGNRIFDDIFPSFHSRCKENIKKHCNDLDGFRGHNYT